MNKKGQYFLGAFAFLIILFLLSPLLWVVDKGLSLKSFAKLFERKDILLAAGDSLILAFLSSTLTTFLGSLIAFGLPDLPKMGRWLIRGGLVFPMVLPEIAVGLSFMVWFVKLGIPLGWTTLLSSHIAFSLSYSVLVMKSRVEVLDKSLFEAAQDLGASPWGLFRHALWPQLMPGIVASLLTCFSLSLDDFLISFFVKGIDQKTLPIQVYSMMRLGVGPEIYSLSVILFCISLLVVLLSQIWLNSKSKSTPSLL